MKTAILAAALLFSQLAYAGSANCTSPTTQIDESPQYYTAPSSDCVIEVNRTSFTPVQIALPANPSVGDFFKVVDITPFQYDQCDQPFWDEDRQEFITLCSAAAVSVVSYNDTHLIAGSNEIANAGYYEQGSPLRYVMEFSFNGTEWDLNFY